jgi:hypothetical protein
MEKSRKVEIILVYFKSDGAATKNKIEMNNIKLFSFAIKT